MRSRLPHCFELLEARRLLNGQAVGWSDVIDNPFMPVIPGTTYDYKGTSDGAAEKDRVIVTDDVKVINGVNCTVVFDRVFEDGELTEKTYDWFAQDALGNVWYFGEDSRSMENGKVVSREGSWQAGVNGATAGIVMQAHPAIGDHLHQEDAVGVAEDEAEVIAQHQLIKTPFQTFGDGLQTKESSVLEPDTFEHKFYAAGIGFVSSQAFGSEDEVLKLSSITVAPEAFAPTIDNPFMPLIAGSSYVYKGTNDGEAETERFIVTHDTKVITGVTCTAIFDRVFLSGELAEKTYDWFAQDKMGNVWYFGEDSRDIENGRVVSREGSWEAGVNGAKAGIVMKAHSGFGDAYREEVATGVAEDQAKVLSVNTKASTPFGNFGSCVETEDFTQFEPTVDEHKFFAAGIGQVKSQAFGDENEILKLVAFTP